MTKILFDYNDESGTCCTVTGAAAGTLLITRTRGEHTLENIPLDAYQAALLLEELQDFVKTRKPHVSNKLFWFVRDGGFYVNDVHVCNLRTNKTSPQVLELLSTLLTANKTTALFTGCPCSYGDVALEQWIQTRLDTFNEACEF